MRDKFFDIADLIAEHFVKFVLLSFFVGCTLYLTVTSGPLGLLFCGVVLVFARWAWSDSANPGDEPLEREDRI